MCCGMRMLLEVKRCINLGTHEHEGQDLDLSFMFFTKDKSITSYCDFILFPHLNTCFASQLDITLDYSQSCK
jgi:hypothetical protein